MGEYRGTCCAFCGDNGCVNEGFDALAMWLANAAMVCAPAGVAMNDIACTREFGSTGGGFAKDGFA